MHTPAIRPTLPGIFRIAFVAIIACILGDSRGAAVELNSDERQLAARLTGDSGQRRDRSRMRPDPILTAVARARAEDLAHRRYFDHVNPDGLGPNALVRAAGYALPATCSSSRSGNSIESIGAGYTSPEAAWEGWMNSRAHRTHLLATDSYYRDQTNFGIGTFSDPSSPYRHYWVIITAPPQRSDAPLASRRSEKWTKSSRPVRIAVAVPAWTEADTDDVRMPAESAPRPSATRLPATEKRGAAKSKNSEVPVSAPRPTATRIIGAG